MEKNTSKDNRLNIAGKNIKQIRKEKKNYPRRTMCKNAN